MEKKKCCGTCKYCYPVRLINGWIIWWCTRFPKWEELMKSKWEGCKSETAHWCGEWSEKDDSNNVR